MLVQVPSTEFNRNPLSSFGNERRIGIETRSSRCGPGCINARVVPARVSGATSQFYWHNCCIRVESEQVSINSAEKQHTAEETVRGLKFSSH
jgi:hypothetical protein